MTVIEQNIKREIIVSPAGDWKQKKDFLLNIYYLMNLARNIDEKHLRLLKQGKSFFHIGGSGHEAVQLAAASLMEKGKDWALPYYRDLAFVLAYGLTPEEVFLAALHRANDPTSAARQMPSHWSKREVRIVTQSSPTGTQFLHAVGIAESIKRLQTGEIVYVSSGEGATSEGEFFEAINWSTRRSLPLLFVIQDNKYAISVHVNEQTAGSSISKILRGFDNLSIYECDGTDFTESYMVLQKAIETTRLSQKPSLVHAHVVRLLPHSSSDDQKKYRSTEELEYDKKNDPILKLEQFLRACLGVVQQDLDAIRQQAFNKIEEAAEFAEAQPFPDPSSIKQYLYSSKLPFIVSKDKEKVDSELSEKIVMVDAINHALREEMERDEKIVVFGQDVADPKGGVFSATKGLSTKFGMERVFNAPLAEASIVGVATGMALAGWKPVIEIQFGDYIWYGFMQLRNEIPTIRYRSNGVWSAPVVIRVPVGGYIHGGIYHSQSIETFFVHTPGMYIVFPSNAADAKALLKHAIRCDDPVIFLEHKGLYRQQYASSLEPPSDFLLPFGQANVVKEGNDVTIVTYGATVYFTLEVARYYDAKNISIEVIDLRTLNPLDEETIYASVRKTNRVLVVHEDTLTGGFGGELVARIVNSCFEHLDAPVLRVAAEDTHIAFSPVLEAAILPSKQTIIQAIEKLIHY